MEANVTTKRHKNPMGDFFRKKLTSKLLKKAFTKQRVQNSPNIKIIRQWNGKLFFRLRELRFCISQNRHIFSVDL